jgi:hypothetical protein
MHKEEVVLLNSLGWHLYRREDGFRIMRSRTAWRTYALMLVPGISAIVAVVLLTLIHQHCVPSYDKWLLVVAGVVVGFLVSRPPHLLIDGHRRVINLRWARLGLLRHQVSFSHLLLLLPCKARKGRHVLYVGIADEQGNLSRHFPPYVAWESVDRSETVGVLKDVFGVTIVKECSGPFGEMNPVMSFRIGASRGQPSN